MTDDIRKTRHRFTLAGLGLALAVLLSACGNFIDDRRASDRQSSIELAKQDDARCVEEGYEYPSSAYTRCRQSLQDRREDRHLRTLRMLDPERGEADTFTRPTTQRGDFRCERREWGDTEWIACGVR